MSAFEIFDKNLGVYIDLNSLAERKVKWIEKQLKTFSLRDEKIQFLSLQEEELKENIQATQLKLQNARSKPPEKKRETESYNIEFDSLEFNELIIKQYNILSPFIDRKI